jgi:hypothetical protein
MNDPDNFPAIPIGFNHPPGCRMQSLLDGIQPT